MHMHSHPTCRHCAENGIFDLQLDRHLHREDVPDVQDQTRPSLRRGSRLGLQGQRRQVACDGVAMGIESQEGSSAVGVRDAAAHVGCTMHLVPQRTAVPVWAAA